MSSPRPQHLPVSVSVRYNLDDGEDLPKDFLWDGSNLEQACMGLPKEQEAVQPIAGDFSYSGVHDHGKLPELQQGGPMALLIACVERAKQTNDEFLTAHISGVAHVDKRLKTDESEDA